MPAVRVADEVWIATALLHREYPERKDFTIQEIKERAARERLTVHQRPGVAIHAHLHCVANRAPNPGRYRMLYATREGTRRLWRPSDDAHPARTGKNIPRRDQIPAEYHELLDWYERVYAPGVSTAEQPRDTKRKGGHPLLALLGTGRDVWKDEDPDEYVRKLREGWD
jgi:hypothetical protein